jgi:hypothetical protein
MIMPMQQKICLKRRIIRTTMLVAVLGFGGLLFLAYSDPQASRWVYIFQAYYYPKHRNGLIPVPDEYTGEWREWYLNGRPRCCCSMRNGKGHGKGVNWNEDGTICSEYNCYEGNADGLLKFWDYKNGMLHTITYDRNIPCTPEGLRTVYDYRKDTIEEYVHYQGNIVSTKKTIIGLQNERNLP